MAARRRRAASKLEANCRYNPCGKAANRSSREFPPWGCMMVLFAFGKICVWKRELLWWGREVVSRVSCINWSKHAPARHDAAFPVCWRMGETQRFECGDVVFGVIRSNFSGVWVGVGIRFWNEIDERANIYQIGNWMGGVLVNYKWWCWIATSIMRNYCFVDMQTIIEDLPRNWLGAT